MFCIGIEDDSVNRQESCSFQVELEEDQHSDPHVTRYLTTLSARGAGL
jgi:hypothetical protein